MESWLHEAARAAETSKPVKLGSAKLEELAEIGDIRILLCKALEGGNILAFATPENLSCPMAEYDAKCSLRELACPNDAKPAKREDFILNSGDNKARIHSLLEEKIAG